MRVANCVQASCAVVIYAALVFEPGASAMPPGKALKIEGMRSLRASTGTAGSYRDEAGVPRFMVVLAAGRLRRGSVSPETPQKGQNRSLRDTLNGLPPIGVINCPIRFWQLGHRMPTAPLVAVAGYMTVY